MPNRFEIADEVRYSSPLSVACGYPSSRTEQQTHIVLGWLCDYNSDVDAYLDWSLLSELLLNNSASPLRKVLEQYPHAQAVSSLSGLSANQREMAFVCGVEGSDPAYVSALEALILKELTRLAKEGFDQDSVAAILQQLTLSQREITGSRFPYGLQLILRALPAMVDYADPLPFLDLEPALSRLETRAKDPAYLKRFIQEKLLDNTHRVSLTMKPDAAFLTQLTAMEKKQLKGIADAMDDDAKRALQKANKILAEHQNKPDDVSCLPTLSPDDIPKKVTKPALPKTVVSDQNHVLIAHPRTNGLVYQEIMIPLSGLDPSLHEHLHHYVSFINELGAGKHDYQAMQTRQSRYLGGLSAYLSMNTDPSDVAKVSGCLILSAKALSTYQKPMTEIMCDLLDGLRFDEHDRILELISEWRIDHEQSITASGHSMAMLAASSAFRHYAFWQHASGGLLGVKNIQLLHQKIQNKSDLKAFSASLTQLHQWVKTQPKSLLWMGEDSAQEPALKDLSNTFGKAVFQPLDGQNIAFDVQGDLGAKAQIWLLDTKVNFSAKAYPAVGYDHPDAPLLSVLASVLSHGYLHGAIRERGGAYGGGASFVSDSAVFRFYAYRDPRLAKTFEDFDHSIDWVFSKAFTKRHVSEAILSVISSIDKPVAPFKEVRKQFYATLYGRSKSKLEAYRRAVMSASCDDIRRVAKTYLQDKPHSKVTITSKAQAKQLSWDHAKCVDLA